MIPSMPLRAITITMKRAMRSSRRAVRSLRMWAFVQQHQPRRNSIRPRSR